MEKSKFEFFCPMCNVKFQQEAPDTLINKIRAMTPKNAQMFGGLTPMVCPPCMTKVEAKDDEQSIH